MGTKKSSLLHQTTHPGSATELYATSWWKSTGDLLITNKFALSKI